jgi:phage-related protein
MEHISYDILPPGIKRLRFMANTRREMADLPDDARSLAGFELFAVQGEQNPTDVKPMRSVGAGVYELRIHTRQEHRVFYVAKFPEAVYVLHVFEKRTRKTSERDLKLGQRRYADMQELRRDEGLT